MQTYRPPVQTYRPPVQTYRPPVQTFEGVIIRRALGKRLSDGLDVVSQTLGATPFGTLAELEAIAAPVVVVGTRDDYDIDHPHELAERYAAALPSARFVCEPEGKMPLAWKGDRVSKGMVFLLTVRPARSRAAWHSLPVKPFSPTSTSIR